MRWPKEKMEARIKDENGRWLINKQGIVRRWKEYVQYFEELLDVTEDKEVEQSTLRRGY